VNKFFSLLLALAVPLAPPLFAQGRGGGLANNAASPIVFNGLIVQDGQTKVSLYNPNTGDAQWVVVGKKFGSYTVARYQPGVPGQTADAVVLTLGASSQRITLQGSADLSAASVATATALKTSLADALARARSAPNSEPRAIQTLESMLHNAQMAESVGANVVDYGRVTISTDGKGQQVITINGGYPLVVINNVTGAATQVAGGSEEENPDGSTTHTGQDASGRVLTVITLPATAR